VLCRVCNASTPGRVTSPAGAAAVKVAEFPEMERSVIDQQGFATARGLKVGERLAWAVRRAATRDDPKWSRAERQLAQPVWTLRLAHHPDRRSASSCGTSKPLET
jgi:hypothetical protein